MRQPQMEHDLAEVGSCSGRKWSASDAARICERCDAAEEKTSCRFPWLYARGNERVVVTELPPRAFRNNAKPDAFVELRPTKPCIKAEKPCDQMAFPFDGADDENEEEEAPAFNYEAFVGLLRDAIQGWGGFSPRYLVEWPRPQKRDSGKESEIVYGTIESTLALIRGRGFSVDIATPARTADEVVRRRWEPRVVGAEQPAEVCCAPESTALAA